MSAFSTQIFDPNSSAQQAGLLSEVFSGGGMDHAALGFVLTRLPKTADPVLWVQDRASRREVGKPCMAGIDAMRGAPQGDSTTTAARPGRPVIAVDLSRPADVLWAMEDGLRCRGLGAVIGEVWGDPAALTFTASKRLALRAQRSGVPCWLIRHGAQRTLSAARDRWSVTALPSAPHPYDAQAPGAPRWSVELFRSRASLPGHWVAQYERAADRVDLSAPIRDGAVDPQPATAGQRAIG